MRCEEENFSPRSQRCRRIRHNARNQDAAPSLVSAVTKSPILSAIAQLNDVVKRYGGVTALDGVSVTIQPGITGLLGPNGSGKSTLIKAVLGLVKTQQGSGAVFDKKWPDQVREIRDLVGYSPEDDCYVAGLTGIESVALMAELSGLPRLQAVRRSHEILDFCDVGEERYREVEGYSTGMRQKLKFAQAIVHDPPLLILDEPTTGLDPQQRQSMLDRIRTLGERHGKTILLSTHILPDVRSVCDQVVILVRGTIRVADTLENLSRPAEPTLQVGLSGDVDSFMRTMTEQGHAVEAIADGTYKVTGIEPRSTDQVWRAAAASNVAITKMSPARNSLEEMFFQATRDIPRESETPSEVGHGPA